VNFEKISAADCTLADCALADCTLADCALADCALADQNYELQQPIDLVEVDVTAPRQIFFFTKTVHFGAYFAQFYGIEVEDLLLFNLCFTQACSIIIRKMLINVLRRNFNFQLFRAYKQDLY
jgi:hypothetical protein